MGQSERRGVLVANLDAMILTGSLAIWALCPSARLLFEAYVSGIFSRAWLILVSWFASRAQSSCFFAI